MKKKKGFTLIELLAVIVILAIIALIAVPVIMNVINKANKSAFKDTAYGLISAGELYYAEQQLELNGMSSEETFTFPTEEIEIKGNVPAGTVLKVNTNGETALSMTNGRYCITKGYSDKDISITEEFTECNIPTGDESTYGEASGTAMLLEDVSTTPHKAKITGTPGTKVYISGKNLYNNSLLPAAGETLETNGLTFIGNEDGTITVNGTSTAPIKFYDTSTKTNLGVGSYTSLAVPGYNLGWKANSENNYLVSDATSIIYDVTTFTTTTNSFIYIGTNGTFNNDILYPYAELNSFAVSGMHYEKFKGIYEYTIGEEGFVEVDSIAPNMTIIANEQVTVNYKRENTNEYPLKNKKIMFFGDSITAVASRYRMQLLNLSEMNQVESFAVSGATLRNSNDTVLDGNPTTSSNNTIPNQVQKLLNTSDQYVVPEIIVLFAGTNDSHEDNVSIESQMSCSLNECDLTSFAGSLRWSTEKLVGLYPDATIFVATPLKSFSESRPDELQGAKADMLKEIASALNINVIDIFTGVDIVEEDLSDKIHPSETGAQKIAEYFYQELLRYYNN